MCGISEISESWGVLPWWSVCAFGQEMLGVVVMVQYEGIVIRYEAVAMKLLGT